MEPSSAAESLADDGGRLELALEKLAILYAPSVDQVVQFYLIWMLAYFVLHVLWDAFSANTPKFHLGRLRYKISILFSGSTFASSLLIIASIFDDSLQSYVFDQPVFLILLAGAGLIMAIAELQPQHRAQSIPTPQETAASGPARFDDPGGL